ncbi:MAG: hypothetical protein JSU97_09015 [Dehalococcoidia bacterium]|nr:MAG: hypothetical protein JSU97_09015 [Dehalococcoidia bacterium]
MAAQTDVAEESPGAMLARLLVGQRTFLENVYSLVRFLEAEVTKRGWDLIKNGGYGVTRNGMGRRLTSFVDWAVSQVGIAFVRPGQAQLVQGVTNTQIPPEGLEVLVFQVRCLDKAPAEPVMWHAKLLVEPKGSTKPKKWEDYQSTVFNRLEPVPRPDEATSGDIKPGEVPLSGTAIIFTGRYGEVPIAGLLTQEDVISQLVEPALGEYA